MFSTIVLTVVQKTSNISAGQYPWQDWFVKVQLLFSAALLSEQGSKPE
jgi:hypothetical protein